MQQVGAAVFRKRLFIMAVYVTGKLTKINAYFST
jgi:hypothetical protein